MKNINKILAVSVIAMLAVPAAQAKIVAETMLSSEAGHYSGTHTVQSEIDAKATKATTLSGYGITDAYTKTETGTQITNAVNALNSTSTGTGTVVKGVSQENGKVSVTVGTIANADVASNAAIAVSKISGAEATANKTKAANATTDLANDSKKDVNYPTLAATKAIADASAAAAVSGASGNYVPTSRTVNSKALSDNITLDGSDVKVKTGYAKKTGNVAAGDTIDTAIGKLETKADNAATTASNAATAAAAAQTTADGKIDKTIANDKNGLIVRNSAGLAMKGTGADITVSDAGAITVAHATAANSATTATKATQDASGNVITTTYATKSELTTGLAAKEDNANKLTSDVSRNSTNLQSDTLYPTVATTQAMITDVTGALQTAVGNKQNKSTENYQMGNSSGGWTTMTTAQQNALNSGATTAKINQIATNTTNITNNANKIGSGTISAKGANGTDAAADLVAAVNAIDGRLASATSTANNAVAKTSHTKNTTLSVKSDGSVVDGTVSGSNGVSASVNDSGNITVSGNNASTSAKGVVQLADSAAVTAGTAGRVVDAAQLKTVADSVTTTNSNKQDKLGGTAGKLVVTTATAGTVAYTDAVPTSIPATPSKDGVFVLTAKNDNGTTTFYWEDIGR